MTLPANDCQPKPAQKRPVKKSFLNAFSNYFYEFSDNTTIHGFKYIVESGRYAIERLWWFAMLCVCVYVCGTLIIATLQKWETNPVFISFSQTPMRLWNVPFPAVTVCPSNKIMKSRYDYVKHSVMFKRKTLPQEQLKSFADMTKFCEINIYNFTDHHMDLDSVRLFLKRASKSKDVIIWCDLNRVSCFSSFTDVLTDYGLCYTFNTLDPNDMYENLTYVPENQFVQPNISRWSIDDNYEKTNKTVYPLRATSTTDKLHITLHTEAAEFNRPCGGDRSFKILFHHPAEVPTLSTQFINLAADEGYNIKITPEVTLTSPSLKDYDPVKRGCYYSTERKLQFYKVYTDQVCRVECLANHTLKQCGCVSYFMPHEAETRICGFSDNQCESTAESKLLLLDLDVEIAGKDQNSGLSCNCLPLCTSIRYNADITQSHAYDTSVDITFKDSKFSVMERNELFSNADFWASCGGLLGLFVGFSVLSFAEIVYFLSLRWVCNVWSLRKRCW